MTRPLSLQARSLTAAGIALVAFMGITFFALDRAFYDAAESSLRERLQGYMYAYLAASDTNRSGLLIPPEVGPDPRFDRPLRSGLYAGISGDHILGGEPEWRSPSANGRDLPFQERLPRGSVRFAGPLDTPVGELFVLSQGVDWTTARHDTLHLTFHVAEDTTGLNQQVEVYRRTLLFWLGGLAAVLLLLLVGVLRWSLAPLRQIAADLRHVERGTRQNLGGNYPQELSRLAVNINTFIDAERDRLERYRNTLSDLAHSLKTPLAVMRSQLESEERSAALRWTVLQQVGRMDEIVAYQLSRAATSGHQTFATPLPVERFAEEVVQSLEKVYASKGILCEFDIDADARFYGDQGDLMELLGNLLENAFKWGRHSVMLSARALPDDSDRSGLEIVIDDDGEGVDAERIETLLQRGVRGDERVQGHGIGLGIVQDILRAYAGELHVSQSPAGGARFTVRIGGARPE